VSARRARVSADPTEAAHDLMEAMGPRADDWLRAVASEMRADLVPTDLVVRLANIATMVEPEHEATIVEAVAVLTGRP